jgi:hypothetical protein
VTCSIIVVASLIGIMVKKHYIITKKDVFINDLNILELIRYHFRD